MRGGGCCLDFEISYLRIISQSFQNLSSKPQLSYSCKSVDLDPRDAQSFVAFIAKAGLTGKQGPEYCNRPTSVVYRYVATSPGPALS